MNIKSLLDSRFAALALGLALLSPAVVAAPVPPEIRAARLNQLVGLSSRQEREIENVFRKEDAELSVLAGDQRLLKSTEIRQDSRDRVRALLTPPQQNIYDRTPAGRGGGLTLATPESKVAHLDETVGLTPEQNKIALAIFQAEFDGLLAIPPAERGSKGAVFRKTAQEQMRELLSPDQLDKMDGVRNAALAQDKAERTALEDQLRASPGVTARLGRVLTVSSGGGAATNEGSDGSRSGWTELRAVGADRSETFKVVWEKVLASGQIRILRIEAGSGEAVQP